MRETEFSEYASARWLHLVRSAALLGAELHEAEDLAQTTLLRCYVSWGAVARATDRDAYVAKALINAHRQSRRRRWWQERPSASLPEVAEQDHSARVDGTETVRRALRSLSQAHREVVVLRFYEHLSHQQMADALGVSPGTVKSRLSRALTHLSASPDLADLRPGGDT